ncbi:gp627 [Bacillus phage G]|uniref:Gp627 n=1 Tax=Bacillus phage G TaxID=2884420 RepID=G3MB07_9CAUD|nr:gp627 [Bacillus phage G]AEO93872.1 gp627 [Bacillus phage G]
MITMQDKILSHIDSVARDNGFEAVVSDSGNRDGTIYIMDGIKTILTISFKFNISDCYLRSFVLNNYNANLDYEDSIGFSNLFDYLDVYLRKFPSNF